MRREPIWHVDAPALGTRTEQDFAATEQYSAKSASNRIKFGSLGAAFAPPCRGGWMSRRAKIFVVALAALGFLAGLVAATQFLAHVFAGQTALGAPLTAVGETAVYAPWAVLAWSRDWAGEFPRPFAV
ncbi:MAG TPA: hypothetical protein DHW63_02700, partial [Hyphomonadaceae bacterium]|nr:hypothetical protein [Hyphomonadaceae bacterium]